MFFRVLEELAESVLAEDPEHKKEEVIDAMNYLMSAVTIQGTQEAREKYAQVAFNWSKLLYAEGEKRFPTYMDRYQLGTITEELGGKVCNFLRNRAWMKQSQDIYFSGDFQLRVSFGIIMSTMFASFIDWDDFAWFWWAKHKVLQFRLETNY